MVQRWYKVGNANQFADLATDTIIEPYLSLIVALMTSAGWSR